MRQCRKMTWRCGICLMVMTITLKDLLRHIHEFHAKRGPFTVTCGIDGCPRTYNKFHSFYKHVCKIHKSYYNMHELHTNSVEQEVAFPNRLVNLEDDVEVLNNDDLELDNSNMEIGCAATNAADESYVSQKESMRDTALSWILKVKNTHNLTQAAVDDVVQCCSAITEQAVSTLKKKIHEDAGVQQANCAEDVLDIVKHATSPDPFEEQESGYKQRKRLMQKCDFVEPREIVLGQTVKRRKQGDTHTHVAFDDIFYYVPILDSITQFMKNERVYGMLTCHFEETQDGFLSEMADGHFFKSHPIFGTGRGLAVMLYYDDIEMCNPLGSKSQKMSMFYYTLANINSKFRSKLASIKMLGLCPKEILQKHGINKVLAPFVQDMNILSEGYEFKIYDQDVFLRGTLMCAIGDTPASHLLGGFKEGVGGSTIKCRHCMCMFDQMQICFVEDGFEKLTLESYMRMNNEISLAPTSYMQNYLKSRYGLNRRSILCDIAHFDVSLCLPQDLMHIMYEGVFQYEVKEILKYYIVQHGTISLHALNTGIQNFPYSYFMRDIPSKIDMLTLVSEDNRLKQSASQISTLVLVLPFVLLDFGIQKDDEHFMFLTELIDIVHILAAPIISIGTINVLKMTIRNHLESFKNLFKDCNIIPKQHYLLHFPRIILNFGPCSAYSCMRFESKHRIAKRESRKGNSKNLAKTIVENMQMADCIATEGSISMHPIFASERLFGPSKEVKTERLQQVLNCLHDNLGINPAQVHNVNESKHCTLYGTKYVSGECLLAVNTDGILPYFGTLTKIYTLNNVTDIFQIEMYQTILFNQELHAYEVQKSVDIVYIKPADLLDTSCYKLIQKNNEYLVPLKYTLDDIIDAYKLCD